ncbi:hypothetical protein OCB72_29015 [Bacillus cereus]|nr:hypothetical protein [Bacillus cereus]
MLEKTINTDSNDDVKLSNIERLSYGMGGNWINWERDHNVFGFGWC